MIAKLGWYQIRFNNFVHDHTIQSVQTEQLDNGYKKVYVGEDGKNAYEVSHFVVVDKEVEINLCKVVVKIEMLETEYWDDDNSESVFVYQPCRRVYGR